MLKDIKYLILSYLQLNELLQIYKSKVIDNLLKTYVISLPDIDQVSSLGEIYTLKYLYKKNIKPTKNTIREATINGRLEVVKYLIRKGFKPTIENLIIALNNGDKKVSDYLSSNNLVNSCEWE